MPSCPKDSVRKGSTGLTIAEIDVDYNGVPARVAILEAPDDAIAAATTAALERWRFRPATIRGVPVRVIGKITFYFDQISGECRVREPGFKRTSPDQAELSRGRQAAR